jgi:hypothetical protein
MRNIIIATLLLYSSTTVGQKGKQSFFALSLQPELTSHKNNYAYRWRDTYNKSTFNIGIEATLRYYLINRLFSEIGIGYVSRKLNTTVFLNQNVLPPPRQSFSQELVNTKSVSFRTVQFPINLGYNFIAKNRLTLNLNTGFTGNFLVNTYYGLGSFKKYEGSYKKNYWQGYSLNIGVGGDYNIFKKFSLTTRIEHSVINTVKDDEYLFSQDEYVIPLPHKYLRLSVGLRRPL